jgi:hypothetical protein
MNVFGHHDFRDARQTGHGGLKWFDVLANGFGWISARHRVAN